MRMRPTLTQADVTRMMEAACARAIADKLAVTIAIVDDGGFLLSLNRLDGASRISSEVATGKARTAALMRRPSALIEKMVEEHPPYVRIPHLLPMAGGLPLVIAGECVGAVGVTGAALEQDLAVANVAVEALGSAAAG